MARLPIDIMTATDQANLPTGKMQVQPANAEDFGAGIGRAIQGFGEAGAQLAQKIAANEKQIKAFDYEQQFARIQEEEGHNYAERQRKMTGAAEGHWQGARQESQATFETWLKTLPREQQAEYSARAQKLVAGRSAQAFQDQYKQQDAHTRNVLTEEQRKAGLGVQQSPQSYEQYVAAQTALIDKSTLTPIEKESQKAAIRNSLAYQAELSRAQKDPAGVIGASTGDAVEASKALIRQKEGFRSSTYWDVTAHRTGYGSDTITKADGSVAQVRQGDTVSREDAERDLERRVKQEFMPAAVAGVGERAWKNLTPAAQAVMVSLTYNYGAGAWDSSLQSVGIAAQSGDPQKIAGAVRALAGHNNGVNASRRNSEAAMVLAGKASGEPVSAANAALTPEQRSSVAEAAQRKLAQDQASTSAAQAAALAEQQNQTYIGIKEGPNPRAVYEQARRSRVIRDFEDIQKAERVLKEREGADETFNEGAAIMSGGRSAANPFSKEHKAGLDAVYERSIKEGGDPSKTAAAIFDRTGVIPPQFATAIRGALASDNAGQLAAALSVATRMRNDKPQAFAGVEGRAEIDKAIDEYQSHTSLGRSGDEAVKRMLADRRDPAYNEPVKQEQLNEFRKQKLTQEKIDSTVKSLFGGWISSPSLPLGNQRTAMASDYKTLAEEGYVQFRDPGKAEDYAKRKMSELYGVQNGVVMKHPPSKSGLPGLPGASDPHAWINEQAAKVVEQVKGVVVPGSQVMLVPVQRAGADTRSAIDSGGQRAMRDDSGRRDQRTSFQSVPYQIVVVGKDATQETDVLPGVFFPDIETYVAGKNATVSGGVAIDQFGMQYDVPPHAAAMLQTPEQKARRDKAATDQELRDALPGARAAEAARQGRYNSARENVRALSGPADGGVQYKESGGIVDWLFGGKKEPASKDLPADKKDTAYPDYDAMIRARFHEQDYGRNIAGFLTPGSKASQWSIEDALKSVNGKEWADKLKDLTEPEKDRMLTNWIAAQRSAISSLGFDPRNTTETPKQEGRKLTIEGVYSARQDKMWFYGDRQDSVVHESIHRGVEKLRKDGAMSKDTEFALRTYGEETVTRGLMLRHFGDIEVGGGSIGDKQVEKARELLKSKTFVALLDGLEKAAASTIQRKHPRGPN